MVPSIIMAIGYTTFKMTLCQKTGSAFLILVAVYFATINAQVAQQNDIISASRSLDRFAFKLLAETSRLGTKSMNIALSPYTIWTLMTIISEGARGRTLEELQNVLDLPKTRRELFRKNFQQFSSDLLNNGKGVTLDVNNAIFVTNEFPLRDSFKQVSEASYNVAVMPVDFRDADRATNAINSFIAQSTNNRIPSLVDRNDMTDAAIFMTSVLYFKGQWRYPFNKTLTGVQTFYDDDGQTPLGTVEMMYQAAPFPYSPIPSLNSFVVELPYGGGDKYGMFVILPRKNEALDNVLTKLTQTNISAILGMLAQSEKDYADEDVEVFLPKFLIQSELNMNAVLENLGIRDVFNSQRADLLGIFPQYLYLSRLIQKAVIDVDEEGTVATSAAGGSFAYKTMRPKFTANKPFAYIIIDKQTESVIFAGKVSNPRGICAQCTRK